MGRTKTGLALALVACSLGAPAALAAPGDLDPTFGKDGKTYLSRDAALDLAVQADGGTIAVGDGFVARVKPNGKLDKNFAKKGYVEKPFNEVFGTPTAVAIQPDGAIVIAGFVSSETVAGDYDVAVARLGADGKPDPSFSGDGVVLLSTTGPDNSEGAEAVAIAPDGKILVAGNSAGGGLIARFNPDGTPDATFSGDGWTSSLFGFQVAEFEGVAPGPAGSVYAAGTARLSNNNSDMLAVRVDSVGNPDPGFDADGIQTATFGNDDTGNELVARPDGSIVLGGRGSKRGAFAQLTAAGAPDPAFSGDGRMTAAPLSYTGGMALDAGGLLYAIGGPLAVIRITPAGGVDQSFSRGSADFSLGGAFAVSGDDLALAPDGRVVGAGSALVSKDDSYLGLFRMVVGPGPEDADADGIVDLDDECRYQAGADKHDGCPLVKRKLTLNERNGNFHGKVSVSSPGTELFEVAYRRCLFHGKVTVYEKRGGPDRRVGRTSPGSSWSLDKPVRDGTYYAQLKPKVYADTSLCGGAKSKLFRA